jgi:hypothetical protein
MKPSEIRTGDVIRVIAIPAELRDSAGIRTPQVFRSALGKTFHVREISEHGLLEFISEMTAARRCSSALMFISFGSSQSSLRGSVKN